MIAGMTFIAWLVSAVGMATMWVKLCATAEEKEHIHPLFRRAARRWLAPPAER